MKSIEKTKGLEKNKNYKKMKIKEKNEKFREK